MKLVLLVMAFVVFSQASFSYENDYSVNEFQTDEVYTGKAKCKGGSVFWCSFVEQDLKKEAIDDGMAKCYEAGHDKCKVKIAWYDSDKFTAFAVVVPQ